MSVPLRFPEMVSIYDRELLEELRRDYMDMYNRKEETYSAFHHPVSPGEEGSRESMTEQVYIPLKDQVDEMLLAGRQLEAYRKELYHFQPGEEVNEDFEDPTLHPSFDAADASVERARLIGKRDRLLKQAEVKRLAKAEADAAAEESGAAGEARTNAKA
nr:MAG: hypothetical protein [Microviridae sp.]